MTRTAVFAAAVLLLGLLAPASWAQEPEKKEEPPPEPPPIQNQAPAAPTREELLRLIEEQKQLIAEQLKRIEEMEKKLAAQADAAEAQRKEMEALRLQLESMTRRLDELQSELPALDYQKALEERLKRVEEGAQKAPELPPDVVSAGDFPGSIRIPGTDAAVKFGGRVRVALVATFDPLGSVDRFLTNSIPVGPPPPGVEDKQTNINANTSRFNFELRTPTGAGQMRAFIEGDFFGEGNTFRLRHAYGQFHGFLAGQTWSTFSDPAATHEDLDFEGVSSENVIRQPQIRYTWLPKDNLSIAAAIETPRVSVTNGTGSELFPDLVGRFIWKFKEIGHLQFSAMVKQVRAAPFTDPDSFDSELGWGASLSGVVPFYRWNLTDRFLFQVTGGYGVSRYINDINSLGGQDGVFDPLTEEFEVLPAFGWYLVYEHMWKSWEITRNTNLRSSLIWSVVNVNNATFQADDSYHRTHRLGANVIFSPIKRMDLGMEYIWGTRENKDGNEGKARQLQTVVIFRF